MLFNKQKILKDILDNENYKLIMKSANDEQKKSLTQMVENIVSGFCGTFAGIKLPNKPEHESESEKAKENTTTNVVTK